MDYIEVNADRTYFDEPYEALQNALRLNGGLAPEPNTVVMLDGRYLATTEAQAKWRVAFEGAGVVRVTSVYGPEFVKRYKPRL